MVHKIRRSTYRLVITLKEQFELTGTMIYQVFRKLAICSDYNDAGGPDIVRICPTIFQHHGTATAMAEVVCVL